MSKTLEDTNLRTSIELNKHLWVAMGIVLCSLLPFVHDIITDNEGAIRSWMPDFGIVDFLTNEEGHIWGYSSYSVFLFIGGIYVSIFLGWLVSFYLAKNKPYRFAFLLPTVLTGYQLFLIAFNLKTTELNSIDAKIILFLLLVIVLAFKFFSKSKYLWYVLGIVLCSLLPFIHDILTDEVGNSKGWVPNLGIVDFLTTNDGRVWGYSDYGIFLFIGGLHLSIFLAWFIALHLARFKPYRFAFFFPTVLAGYQFFLILFNFRSTKLNALSSKIVVFVVIGILLVLNFFLSKKRRKKLQ